MLNYDCLKEAMKKIIKINEDDYANKILEKYNSFDLNKISCELYKTITKTN